MKKVYYLLLAAVFLALFLTGCSGESKTFTILSGSENQSIEPIVADYAKEQGYQLEMVYKGSVDSMLELQNNPEIYDGIWLPNSMWIHMGDTNKTWLNMINQFLPLQLYLELKDPKLKS